MSPRDKVRPRQHGLPGLWRAVAPATCRCLPLGGPGLVGSSGRPHPLADSPLVALLPQGPHAARHLLARPRLSFPSSA